MLRRSRELFADILRQTDLVLLALCAAASLFGVLMVASATRYMQTNRLVIIQGCAICTHGVWWRSSLWRCCWAWCCIW